MVSALLSYSGLTYCWDSIEQVCFIRAKCARVYAACGWSRGRKPQTETAGVAENPAHRCNVNTRWLLQVADSEATLNEVRKQEKVSRADVEALQKDAMETRTALSTGVSVHLSHLG